jgi:hypothetical protein
MSGFSAASAGPSTALRSGRDDKGRDGAFRNRFLTPWVGRRPIETPDDKGGRLRFARLAIWMDRVTNVRLFERALGQLFQPDVAMRNL